MAEYQVVTPETVSMSTSPPADVTLPQTDEHCLLFQFVVDSVILGTLCLLGFAGNTLSVVTLWREKNTSSAIFLLQALNIADFAVIWMLFLGDSVPKLGYVVPVLGAECVAVCGYVRTVTRPLLFLAQTCVVWFTLLAVNNRFTAMCRPVHAARRCTVHHARREVLITTITALLLTLPLTFDTSILISYRHHFDNLTTTETLAENHWYRAIYRDALSFIAVFVVPFAALLYLGVRLFAALRSMRQLRRSFFAEQRAQQVDTTQVLLTLCITVVICYLPVMVLRGLIWAQGDLTAECGELQYYLTSFSNVFQALNSSIKVIILALFAQQFRRTLSDNLHCASSKSAAAKQQSMAQSDSVYSTMYKCSDMSEMTLISHVDNRHNAEY